jgi:hypothetical protein
MPGVDAEMVDAVDRSRKSGNGGVRRPAERDHLLRHVALDDLEDFVERGWCRRAGEELERPSCFFWIPEGGRDQCLNVADDAALPLELGRSGEHDVALLAVLLAAHARGDGSHSFIAGEDAQKPLQDLDSLTDGLFRCSSARIASLLQRPPQPVQATWNRRVRPSGISTSCSGSLDAITASQPSPARPEPNRTGETRVIYAGP